MVLNRGATKTKTKDDEAIVYWKKVGATADGYCIRHWRLMKWLLAKKSMSIVDFFNTDEK